MSHSQLLRNHFGSRLNSALSFADGRRCFVGLLSRSLIWIRQRLLAALGTLPERANDLARCSARGRCTSGTRECRARRRLLGDHRRRVGGAHHLQRVRPHPHQAGGARRCAAVRGSTQEPAHGTTLSTYTVARWSGWQPDSPAGRHPGSTPGTLLPCCPTPVPEEH